ncbi:P-loop containing nucleoside triphosphate hydrolase protein [Amniculicola lignicola CBS 123094]|uniref:P-loop containing nucleoside triphosphate hydrolase protein n=1 Tax=Amniculicola lignicola CBS 123094 TaxID=1392246 RepID=A0A6A5W2F7_9PLEO|nr:P-loop containing nucleoside triphosphate hydrolase protein [Amniculicola lignicola CBS 123094]
MYSSLPLPTNWVSLVIASIFTLVALRAVYLQYHDGKPKDRFYQDIDGSATPEAIASLSSRRVKFAILYYSILGTATSALSLAAPFLYEIEQRGPSNSWAHVASWGLISLQAVCVLFIHSSMTSSSLCLLLAISTCTLAISSVAQLLHNIAEEERSIVKNVLLIIDISTAIGLGIVSLTPPRRPDVFYNSRVVDRQRTVSILSRYTWSWFEPLYQHAALHNGLTAEDIPRADARLRSVELKDKWDRLYKNLSLRWSFVSMYRRRFILLWAVTLIRCAVGMLPFWAMYCILEILRDRNSTAQQSELISTILLMVISNLVDSWIEGWLYWYSLSALALPIRAQISNLVFEKALRCKGTTSLSRESATDLQSGEKSLNGQQVSKPNPAIVNLVGIDTDRLFYFVQNHFMLLNGVFKVIIFYMFLIRLLGWKPCAAGVVAWALMLPAHTWFSNKLMSQSRILMNLRDMRVSKISEMLVSMRQIKFSAMEPQWLKIILGLREHELRALWKFFIADSGLASCSVLSPILVAVATLSCWYEPPGAYYVLINTSLTPSVAFVSIGIFNTLETSLEALPELLTQGFDSLVSLKRIQTFLQEQDWESVPARGSTISFKGASISWPSNTQIRDEERFVIRNIDLSFPSGGLSVISGETGSGKTLLLSAILGEIELREGLIQVPSIQRPGSCNYQQWIIPGSVAYISQTPWLENASLRDNILFGLPFLRDRYENVIDACALKEDLATNSEGDAMELGINGSNLSGGQRWRVTLARAVYSRAEILLLEDVFSAVDTQVGAHILSKCLLGDLCLTRTRILATHHLGLVLDTADFLVELGSGRVLYSGLPSKGVPRQDAQHQRLSSPDPIARSTVEPPRDTNTTEMPAETDLMGSLQSSSASKTPLMQEEICQKGKIKGSVYLAYIQGSGSLSAWVLCVGIFIAYQIGIIARAWWLGVWTSHTDKKLLSSDNLKGNQFRLPMALNTHHYFESTGQSSSHEDVVFYLKIWITISLAAAIIGVFRYIVSYALAIRGSRTLFRNMLHTVSYVPLQWLDTVPIGRVLNRFTADINTIDGRVPTTWNYLLADVLRLIGICAASSLTSSWLIPPAIVLIGLATVVGGRYVLVSRALRRLENISKSPVFETFNTTVTGIATIRAYRRTQTYITKMHHQIDAWTMNTFYIALANRWMSFRMALIAALFTLASGIVLVVIPIDTSLVGLALSFILDFTESLRFTIRWFGDLELEMSAMERVLEYTTLPTEPITQGKPPAAAWPASGAIEFEDLEVSYAPHLPPVLKSISLQIRHGERIGVVGRTGAGKSSLTLALFRFLEPISGRISIDGVDTSSVALADLRSRLAIIPQHPVLFSGTIRSNMDPFNTHSDTELFDVLAKVNLITPLNRNGRDTDNNMFEDLSHSISESGKNLSQGQQQLLSIARALLSRSKIIVLDEATSAVDMATDQLIQDAIRDWFNDSTLIVIAHRLSTVCHFDRIMVLDFGQMVELGTPRELWEKEGVFRSMCEQAGQGEKEKLRETFSSK